MQIVKNTTILFDPIILPVRYVYAETHCIRKDTMMANI